MQTIIMFIIIAMVKSVINHLLFCSQCGQPFSSTDLYIKHHSNEALNKGPKSQLKLFKNKSGKYFSILTLSQTNLVCHKTLNVKDTFFPGYMWSICVCPTCSAHLGWLFYPDSNKCLLKQGESKKHKCEGRSLFYGVILENIQNRAISLEKIDL